jgi:nucleoside-diphosphate-sugar epimerase|tara:strand:+ start:15674 stop:16666 length:993 start_codon:yes stop_codon:yes gene_type:complete
MVNNNNILLVGGEGYIGQVTSSILINKNYSIVSYDNLIYDHNPIRNIYTKEQYRLINGDIRKIENEKILFSNIGTVVIFAGLVGDPITKKYPALSYDINYQGIKSVIDKSIKNGIKKIIFISTCSNYGIVNQDELADEKYILNPLSSYSKSKVAIEEYILSLKGKVDSNITILRFATAFGLSSRMRFDLTVNEFVKDIYFNNDLKIYDADTWRPYCHIKDFANIIERVICADEKTVSFQVFNAGSQKNNYTKRMIVAKILKYYDSKKLEFIERKDSDRRDYKVSFNKLENVLGYTCEYTISDGIVEILDYLKKTNIKNNINLGNYVIDEK